MPSLIPISRRILPRLSAVMLACSVLALGACSDDEDAPVAPVAAPVRTVAITPRVSSGFVGFTQQLSAELRNATDQPISGGTVTWRSTDPAIATVSATGLVTTLAPGSTAITATIDGVTGFASVTALAPVNSISITAPAAPLQVGQSQQLVFAALDSRGTSLFRPITFTSSAPTVATVNSTGVVTGVGAGTATITATSEGKTATATVVIVAPAPVSTVTVTPTAAALQPGGSQQLTVVLRDAAGLVLTRPVTYTSSNTAIATVSATGLVNVLTAGQATITATSEGVSATVTVGNTLNAETNYTVAGAIGTDINWTFNVPAGTTSVRVTTTGTGGNANDPDLYVYRAGSATSSCNSENAGPNETCDVATNGVTGLWRIRINGWTAYSGVTLRITFTP